MLSTRAILKRPTFVMIILAALVGFAAPAAADIEVVGNTHGDSDMIRSYFAGTSEADGSAVTARERVSTGLIALPIL